MPKAEKITPMDFFLRNYFKMKATKNMRDKLITKFHPRVANRSPQILAMQQIS